MWIVLSPWLLFALLTDLHYSSLAQRALPTLCSIGEEEIHWRKKDREAVSGCSAQLMFSHNQICFSQQLGTTVELAFWIDV